MTYNIRIDHAIILQNKEGFFVLADKKEALKKLIRGLHEGADPEVTKAKLKKILEESRPPKLRI